MGNFNSHLETTCFVLAEEVLWAGDHRVVDALKSLATAISIAIDEKYRQRRQVPSHLHMMFTTNHEWAISAGKDARRWFVLDVSDEKAQDKSWFDPLYDDLDNGGIAEFLHLLLNLRLGNWHPREVPKTEELVEQQILSADTIEEWLLACADVDSVLSKPESYAAKELGTEHPTESLYDAYCEYVRRRPGVRVQSLVVFGKKLTQVIGQPRRLPANSSGTRKMGYHIPDASALRNAVLRYLRAEKVA